MHESVRLSVTVEQICAPDSFTAGRVECGMFVCAMKGVVSMIRKEPVLRPVYVNVNADFTTDGFVRPRSIVWRNGKVYYIQRMIDWLPGRESISGCFCDRYTVQIRGELRYLYLQRSDEHFLGKFGRWYVKVPESEANTESWPPAEPAS